MPLGRIYGILYTLIDMGGSFYGWFIFVFVLRPDRCRCGFDHFPDDTAHRLGASSGKVRKDVENYEKEQYWKKKRQDKEAAIKKAKEKEKAKKRQARVDKLNQYRAINGKGPLAEKNKDSKKK